MNKCEKTECLMIDVIKHQSKPFTYIVSNGAVMIGELVEDDIANFLSNKANKFLVPVNAIRNIVKTPKIY